ncbi:MAG: FAD-binding protein [Proteobacteria bacterium]|nr:FAD-binding protein [Pseudomonadota bacterium]
MKIVGGKWSNWSGGVVCKPKQIVAPKNEVGLAAAVRTAEGTVRVPGSGHSFTPICESDGTIVDLAAFTGFKKVDGEKQTGTFAAATPLWAVGPALHVKGFGLKNMGDIDRQTLAGVVNTGTHGTGPTLGNFSSEVAGFRLVQATGEVIDCSPDAHEEIFRAGRTSLGMLGVMTEIAMNVRPAYKLVEKNFLLSPKEVFSQLDTLIASNRHFEFFWFPYADNCICKSLNETDREAPAPRSTEAMYQRGEEHGSDARTFELINEVLPYAPFLLKPAHRMFSRFMPGPDRVRWSHELFPSPRTTRFNEMEYAVPVEKGPDCIREIAQTIRKKRINTGFPIEYRTVAADDVWLSPFYQRASATIAVHQYHRVDTAELFGACEAIFRRYEGRPHWGKRHTRTAQDVAAVYPKFDQFRSVRRALDPKGKFLNSHLRAIFG